MAIFVRSAARPVWLDETRSFCKTAGIKIMGWGPDMLTVEAKSPERASQIASQLSQLGFHVVENRDNADAGLLDLSKNPGAVHAKIASFDISRRDAQIQPLIWGACAVGFLGFSRSAPYPLWFSLSLGAGMAVLFCWDAIRIWGWRIEVLPEGLHIRRRYQWTTIPWEQIKAVESHPAKSGRAAQESVALKLVSGPPQPLGTFGVAFGRNLRDRLRYELTQRHP